VTVGAVVVAPGPGEALADAAGRTAVRRIVETAWAGGALPIVVVVGDDEGAVADELAGSDGSIVEPSSAPGRSPVAAGSAAAVERIGETDAVLVWPARHAWVDAETITSLIEAHGIDPDRPLRPTWQSTPGWPILVPLAVLGQLGADVDLDGLPAALGDGPAAPRMIDLGDPGVVIDIGTPLDAIPAYLGPPEPLAPPPDRDAAAAQDLDARSPA
jgi:CTP:molybdopterin cytidylyltransferase MocA